MPLLDVSEVLFDPDFVDTTLTVTRQTQTVDATGTASVTSTTTRFSGAVMNDSGDVLKRLDGGSRIQASINVYTRYPLTAGIAGRDADIVQWQGSRYTVSNVKQYTTYGRGFVVAACDLIPLAGS